MCLLASEQKYVLTAPTDDFAKPMTEGRVSVSETIEFTLQGILNVMCFGVSNY